MYQWLRNVHLAVGLFSAVFLVGFGLSAAQMAYPIYRPSPTESTTTIPVPAGYQINPRRFARWLMDEHDLRGDLTKVNTSGSTISLTIDRPGTMHQVEYDLRLGSARVTTRAHNAVGMLNHIHHTHGIDHDYWATNVWGWLLFLVSILLLVLAVTGIVMWFKRHEDRLLGTIVASAGLAWGLLLIVMRNS